jgi:hypothetical protein
MLSNADLPLLLMCIVAPIGAFDAIYFHLWRFRLYRAPSARCEEATHLVRGIIFTLVAGLLTFSRPEGAWFWVVASLIVLDFLNNLADVYVEGPSREPLGGLPRLEYIVHIIGASSVGAIAVAFLLVYWPNRLSVTALAPAALPPWLWWQGLFLVVGGVVMVGLELFLFSRSILRSGWRPRESKA